MPFNQIILSTLNLTDYWICHLSLDGSDWIRLLTPLSYGEICWKWQGKAPDWLWYRQMGQVD